jgi:hypothetical protein
MTTNNTLKAIHGAVKAGAAVCFIIMALFSGCKDTVSSSPCTCQEKIHGSAPCECGGENCDCKQRNYPLYGGVVLEDTTGLITENNRIDLNQILKDLDDAGVVPVTNIGKIIVENGERKGAWHHFA